MRLVCRDPNDLGEAESSAGAPLKGGLSDSVGPNFSRRSSMLDVARVSTVFTMETRIARWRSDGLASRGAMGSALPWPFPLSLDAQERSAWPGKAHVEVFERSEGTWDSLCGLPRSSTWLKICEQGVMS